MAVIENSVTIRRAPEDVFDYLSDLRNELQWNPKVRVMEKTTDGPLGVGTRFRAKWTKSPLVDVECTEYERPRRWRYVNGGPISVDLTITLQPSDEGTRLASRFVATPHGLMRVVFPVFLVGMRREERRNMALCKAALER